MATVQNIIDGAASIYPTSRSEADQILSISRIQRRLFIELGRDSNQYTVDVTDVTIADQEAYTLPTGCEIHNIVNNKIQVETSESSDEYEDYEYRELDKITDYGNYYTREKVSTKYYLFEDGNPINNADRIIKIRFYKDPTIITSVGDTPTIESIFHDLFIYALVAENASCGEDPDDYVTNYWTQVYMEYFSAAKYRFDDNLYVADSKSTDCKEIM